MYLWSNGARRAAACGWGGGSYMMTAIRLASAESMKQSRDVLGRGGGGCGRGSCGAGFHSTSGLTQRVYSSVLLPARRTTSVLEYMWFGVRSGRRLGCPSIAAAVCHRSVDDNFTVTSATSVLVRPLYPMPRQPETYNAPFDDSLTVYLSLPLLLSPSSSHSSFLSHFHEWPR